MNSDKEKCLSRIAMHLDQLAVLKIAYTQLHGKQNSVLLHFVDRAEEMTRAILLIDALPTPLQVLNRVLCEDLFLICWISNSTEAAEEYEAGALTEMAKMMSASLANGWAVIRNRHTGEAASKEFMEKEFLPKVKAMKTPRMRIEKIAKELGLQKVYDILYRGASLDVHGNTFVFRDVQANGADYRALSSIDAVLASMLNVLDLPRKAFDPRVVLSHMRI